MRRTAWVSVAVLMVAASGVAGQEKSVGRDLEAWAKDILWVWTSPVRMDAHDFEGLGVVAAATGAMLLVDESLYAWTEANPRSLPVRIFDPVREESPLNLIGRSKFLQPLSALMYIAGWAFDEPDLRAAGIGCATSNVSNTLARNFMAQLLGRRRPSENVGAYAFEPLAFGEWENRSFPGGHAANIMTCVSFWNHRFDLGIAEPILYTMAGLVGFARVLDGAHWPSDTVVGMSLGFAVGRGVAGRQLERRREAAEPIVRLGLTVRF